MKVQCDGQRTFKVYFYFHMFHPTTSVCLHLFNMTICLITVIGKGQRNCAQTHPRHTLKPTLQPSVNQTQSTPIHLFGNSELSS
jgi:hypothetical protein